MCENAVATAAVLMQAIEPTLVNLLTVLGIADTPDGKTAIAAFDAALNAVKNWTPGTGPQDVIQVIDAFVEVFDTLPIPTDAKALADVIAAGITTVIGVLTANSPSSGTFSTEEHQNMVIRDTTSKIVALVPGFKLSLWDRGRIALGDREIVASEYKNHWNATVASVSVANSKYSILALV